MKIDRKAAEILQRQFLDTWPEHEKGWTHRAMAAYKVQNGWCPYCLMRLVDNAGKSCTECEDMLCNCDSGSR